MRIAQVTASISRLNGGLHESVRGLAKQIACHPAVTGSVLITFQDRHTDDDLALWEPIKPIILQPKIPRRFRYSDELVKTLLQADPDVVINHGLWLYPSIAVYRWHKLTGRPYIISPHGMINRWAVRHRWVRKSVARLVYENRHWKSAAAFRVLGAEELEEMRSFNLRCPAIVIPNGVDMPPAATVKPEQPPYLLYIGRIHPQKGLRELIDAWRIAKADPCMTVWKLVLAGWSQMGFDETLKALARDGGVGDSVTFVGPVYGAMKQQLLQKASGFVLPSYSEGIPMAVLEAWSYKKPVLMTRACNLPEGFETKAAIEIPLQPEEMGPKIAAFAALSDEKRSAMGCRGFEIVRGRYDWPLLGESFIQAVKWVLHGGTPPACVSVAP